VFTLNAVNYLTDPVKIFIASAATDPYSQTLADSIVATAPTKTAVMQATVQYVISTGDGGNRGRPCAVLAI
jgi:hypothetical protein